ncbi:unnamed protein product [Camellia sinensis]
MSHFGRSGPPDIKDTYSLLVLNITFRTSADDLFPLFEKYGKVVDVFIPRDRRTGDSRGFAFVRYKYADEAQKAVDKLDGRVVDGREIMVQFAKYGPNAEKISEREDSRISIKVKRQLKKPESSTKDTGMNTGTRIIGGEVAAEAGIDMIVIGTGEGKEIIVIEAGAAVQVLIMTNAVGEVDMMMRGVVGAVLMKARRTPSPRRSPSPRRTPPSRGGSPDGRNHKECSPTPKSVSPRGRPADSRSPSRHSDADVRIGSDIVCDESSARILLVVLCVVETAVGEDILRFSMLLSNH